MQGDAGRLALRRQGLGRRSNGASAKISTAASAGRRWMQRLGEGTGLVLDLQADSSIAEYARRVQGAAVNGEIP